MPKDHTPRSGPAEPGDADDHQEHAARLEAACSAFPPLARLLAELEGVSDTGDRRELLVDVSRAMFRFVLALPHHQASSAAAGLVDLMQALHEAQSGSRPPLFEPHDGRQRGRPPDPNALSWGKDLVSSAIAFLIGQHGRSLKDAIKVVRTELKRRGFDRSVQEIRKIHEHRANKDRDGGAPDFRQALKSDDELNAVLELAAKLLKQNGS